MATAASPGRPRRRRGCTGDGVASQSPAWSGPATLVTVVAVYCCSACASNSKRATTKLALGSCVEHSALQQPEDEPRHVPAFIAQAPRCSQEHSSALLVQRVGQSKAPGAPPGSSAAAASLPARWRASIRKSSPSSLSSSSYKRNTTCHGVQDGFYSVFFIARKKSYT